MRYIIAKLSFDEISFQELDSNDLKKLCNKVRQKFKITTSIDTTSDEPAIFIALLHQRADQLQSSLDQISDYCEECGLGRISQEEVIFEAFEDVVSAYQSN